SPPGHTPSAVPGKGSPPPTPPGKMSPSPTEPQPRPIFNHTCGGRAGHYLHRMPELPEVETTRLGISPHVIGAGIAEVIIRRHDLRWPVSENLPELEGAVFVSVGRRSKYLL